MLFTLFPFLSLSKVSPDTFVSDSVPGADLAIAFNLLNSVLAKQDATDLVFVTASYCRMHLLCSHDTCPNRINHEKKVAKCITEDPDPVSSQLPGSLLLYRERLTSEGMHRNPAIAFAETDPLILLSVPCIDVMWASLGLLSRQENS